MNKKTIKTLATGRSIYLIDIENLVGASEISEEQVAQVRADVLSVAAPRPMDQFYVASSHHNKTAASFGWPSATYGFKSGEDGADFMLIKQMIEVGNAQNFDHVYVASGDGGMAWYVNHLASCGVRVTIVANHRGFSGEMRSADADVIWLDDDYALAA